MSSTNAQTTRSIAGVEIPAHVTKVTLIGGGDPDGALWLGLMAKICAQLGIEATFRFERWLPIRDFPDGYVILGDLPLSNQDMAGARAQLEEHAAQIILAVGHHRGDASYTAALGGRALIDETAPSCPAIMAAAGVEIEPWLVRASNYLDAPRGGYTETAIAKVIRWAFDACLVNFNAGDRSALDGFYLVLANVAQYGLVDPRWQNVLGLAEAYEPIFESLEAAVKRTSTLGRSALSMGEVGYVKIAAEDPAPLTTMFGLIYETGKKIVVIQSWSRGTPLTTVALDRGVALDLVKSFGLESGSPSRVVLPGDHEVAMARVMEALQIVS